MFLPWKNAGRKLESGGTMKIPLVADETLPSNDTIGDLWPYALLEEGWKRGIWR
jgi:hypothetical protein